MVKQLLFITCFAIYLGLASSPASASKNINFSDSDFWQGFAGGIVGHELGHIALAAAFGQRSQLHKGSIIYPNNTFSQQESLRVSMAGYQSQWLLSEWSFASLQADKTNALLSQQHHLGIIASHLAITFAYAAGLKNNNTSDIYAAANVSGRTRNQWMAMALLPALIDSYRLFGDDVPAWAGKVSMVIKASEIALIWSF